MSANNIEVNDYGNLPLEEQLSYLQSRISQVDGDEKSRLTKELEMLISGIAISTQKHIVILIHGIRTFAPWQARIENSLDDDQSIKVIPLSYDYYGLRKFCSPKKFSSGPLESLESDLSTIFNTHLGAKFSVVAHSFGTYLISEILRKYRASENIPIENLILCGAIVNKNYQWNLYPANKLLVLNEAGSKDIWPVFAYHISKEYGATGTFGIKKPLVKDRFHSNSHSDYFTNEFIKQYWVPFLKYGQIVNSGWGSREETFPLWIEIPYTLSSLTLSILVLAFLMFVLWALWSHCITTVVVVFALLTSYYFLLRKSK